MNKDMFLLPHPFAGSPPSSLNSPSTPASHQHPILYIADCAAAKNKQVEWIDLASPLPSADEFCQSVRCVVHFGRVMVCRQVLRRLVSDCSRRAAGITWGGCGVEGDE